MPLLGLMSDQRRFAVIILAAGQGTRMRSDTHKVLHPIAGRALLLQLLEAFDALGAEKSVGGVGKRGQECERANTMVRTKTDRKTNESESEHTCGYYGVV